MFKRMTDSPRWRLLTPLLLLVACALLAANLFLTGSAVLAGGDDSGGGPSGPYHEHWMCVKDSNNKTELTFVHAFPPYVPPVGLCSNGEAFVIAVRDNGHPAQ